MGLPFPFPLRSHRDSCIHYSTHDMILNTDRLWCLSLRFFCSIQLLCLSPLWLQLFMVTSTLRSFACWACALHFVVVPFGLSTPPVAFYLSVCLRLYLLVGILKQSGFLVCLRDFFFALIGGSLWALFTPGLCFLVFPVLSSSAWFVGCDGAKLWFTAVDSAVIVMLLSSVHLPASASADFVDLDQLGILEACLLSVLVGVIFFSSRPNKASTAGMSAGNRNMD